MLDKKSNGILAGGLKKSLSVDVGLLIYWIAATGLLGFGFVGSGFEGKNPIMSGAYIQ